MGERRRTRVLVASRIFSPEPAAASFRLRALCDALDLAGAEVSVRTVTASEDVPAATRPGVEIRRWPVLRDRAGYVRGYLQYLSFDAPLALRLLLTRRPDVIVCEPPPTTGAVVRAVARLRRVPYVYYAADLWSEAVEQGTTPRPVRVVLRAVENWALRGARTVLSVSEEVTARLAGRGVDAVATVGNGIDTETFSPAGPRAAWEGPLIVYAGTASEVHGAGIFVDAMRDVLAERPDARLVYIGHGADVDTIGRLASALPDGTVTLRPRQSPETVAAWLRRADVAVASVRPGRYAFAFPSKVYAAMACGTPVVHVGGGPAADLVGTYELGEAVPYEARAVAAALLRVLELAPSPGRRRASAEQARAAISLDEVGRRAAEAVLGAR